MNNRSVIWYENNNEYKGIYIQGDEKTNSFIVDIVYNDKEKLEKLIDSKNTIYSLGLSENKINYEEYKKLEKDMLENKINKKEFDTEFIKNTIYSNSENDIPVLKNKDELYKFIKENRELENHYVYEKDRFYVYTENKELKNGIEINTLDKVKNVLFNNPENIQEYLKIAKLKNRFKWEDIENNIKVNDKEKIQIDKEEMINKIVENTSRIDPYGNDKISVEMILDKYDTVVSNGTNFKKAEKLNEIFNSYEFNKAYISGEMRGGLMYCKEEYRNDEKFVLEAIKYDSSNIYYIGEDLKKDKEFAKNIQKELKEKKTNKKQKEKGRER